METRIISFATPTYDLTIKLRTEILRIPLGMTFSVDDLSEEYKDIHMGCFDAHNQLLACLVLRIIDANTLKMRQVAVSSNLQGKGIGSFLVRSSEQWAIKNNFKMMVLNARDIAIPFYKKLNYFSEGKSFIEVGIVHQKMEKYLSS